jgi:chemotaxis family two-component system response regulator Rcp1
MNVDVLLVEDSPGDVRLTREAFREANKFVQLHVAPDGAAAMAFLRREGAYRLAPRPKLILLDLNLPKMNGHEFLARVKEDEGLKAIPVVIMTTSDRQMDIVKCHRLQANCYVHKPTQFDAFQSLMHSINKFWLTQSAETQST